MESEVFSFAEAVTNAAYGLHKSTAATELRAKRLHMHVYRARAAFIIITPNSLKKLFACVSAAHVLHQPRQEGKLFIPGKDSANDSVVISRSLSKLLKIKRGEALRMYFIGGNES